jgi:hypothetical protein
LFRRPGLSAHFTAAISGRYFFALAGLAARRRLLAMFSLPFFWGDQGGRHDDLKLRPSNSLDFLALRKLRPVAASVEAAGSRFQAEATDSNPTAKGNWGLWRVYHGQRRRGRGVARLGRADAAVVQRMCRVRCPQTFPVRGTKCARAERGAPRPRVAWRAARRSAIEEPLPSVGEFGL